MRLRDAGYYFQTKRLRWYAFANAAVFCKAAGELKSPVGANKLVNVFTADCDSCLK